MAKKSKFKIEDIMPAEIMEGVSEPFQPGGYQYEGLQRIIQGWVELQPEDVIIPVEGDTKWDKKFVQVLQAFANNGLGKRKKQKNTNFKSASELGIDLSELDMDDEKPKKKKSKKESASITELAETLSTKIVAEVDNMDASTLEEVRAALLSLGKAISDSGIDLTDPKENTGSESYQQREKDITPEKTALPH